MCFINDTYRKCARKNTSIRIMISRFLSNVRNAFASTSKFKHCINSDVDVNINVKCEQDFSPILLFEDINNYCLA